MDPRPDSERAAPPCTPEREVFCNRTLNLRAIRAVGYDMDYTLIHYKVEAWERRAYEYLQRKLAEHGWPVEHLAFDPDLMIRGLILDVELGNVVKADRFGYVKRAFHGTRPLEFSEQRRLYARSIIDLAEKRFVFLNTFFSLSEGCMYAQLVELLDERRLPANLGYADLYRRVQVSLDETHMEGVLKAEIIGEPDRYVDLDPYTPLALLDQKLAGKKLMLITNSEWHYTRAMMGYAFDRFLPSGMGWRDLFDVVIVSARKPDFFTSRGPLFEVVSDEGLLRPAPSGLRGGGVFLGGSASRVEDYLSLSGDEILYVGDHLYADVHVSKSVLRWRTALVVRELEREIAAQREFLVTQHLLSAQMADKAEREQALCARQVTAHRLRAGLPVAGPGAPDDDVPRDLAALDAEIALLRAEIIALDERIAPLAKAAAEIGNARWGLLMRAGNDKSHLARQLERHADVYTSRVSNLAWRTPYAYLRAPRGSLPHDSEVTLDAASEASSNRDAG